MKPVALLCLFYFAFALASPAALPKTADTKENVDLSSKAVNVPVVDSKDVHAEKQSTASSNAAESAPDSQTQTGRQGRNYPVAAPVPGPMPVPANDGYHMQEGFEGYLVPSTGIHYSAFSNVPWVMFNVGLAALTLLLSPFIFSLFVALIPQKALLLKLLFKMIHKLKGKPTIGRMMPSNRKLAGLASNVLLAVQKYQKMQTSEADS